MPHLCGKPGAAPPFLAARSSSAEQKPQDWSEAFAILASVFHRTEGEIAGMDEQQMNGYLQHTPTILKMQSQVLAGEITNALAALLKR